MTYVSTLRLLNALIKTLLLLLLLLLLLILLLLLLLLLLLSFKAIHRLAPASFRRVILLEP